MSFVGKAIGSILGPITGASQAADAATNAANIQAGSAQAGIASNERYLAQLQELLKPYTDAGPGALTAQQNLIGLNGNDAQSASIDALKASPQFAALLQQGNDSILSNASATGGLRGGNTQAALAQFSPALLSQLISDQYSRLGGLTQLGQNSAAGVGAAGLQTGGAISNLLQQQGAAQAGGVLAQGGVNRSVFGTALQGLGAFAALRGFGGGGAAAAAPGAGVVAGGSGMRMPPINF